MDYLYLRAWGRILGSHWYYTLDEIKKAKEDGAPQDVIYIKHPPYDGDAHTFSAPSGRVWVRAGGITSEGTKRRVDGIVQELTEAFAQ